ncbi:DNA methyltransferase [Qipengyuania sp.]|uniref:DNA methyltransferase n=1 Tax=Qipengyuania sp. TaxID=2004515 RepID=UPI0037355AB6
MTPDQRATLIELLSKGETPSPEWSRIVFPPERREYELVYGGKARDEEIISETIAVPIQRVRKFGKPEAEEDPENLLIFGDNLQTMKTLLEDKKRGRFKNADGSDGFKLVYIDPPFATKRDFTGTAGEKAYQDRVINSEFLEFLRRRLVFIRELLADDGVLFVHTDWKKGHYIKVLLDEIMGESRFRNEIIWWYYNKMQGNIGHFPSNHECIYFYSKGPKFKFEAQYLEREDTQRLLKRAWDPASKRLVNVRGKDGKVEYIETDERRMDDVWRISMLQPADKKENLRYPTQKPELLLAPIISSCTVEGDYVLDAFAGSGTTLAVAEKLARKWVGIDVGKLSIYTIQKRMMKLRQGIGNTGRSLKPKPFALCNAGLYDFSKLRDLPWDAWRFFALELFQCRDEPHRIGGVQFDGFLRGASVLIFDHKKHHGARIDEGTLQSIHEAAGSKLGTRCFVVAPSLTFDFQQDYLQIGDVRYYALRIPYSIVQELHKREFLALLQPGGADQVNATVEAVGFDFIRTPEVSYKTGVKMIKGKPMAKLKVSAFQSEASVQAPIQSGDLASLSMVMIDPAFDPETDTVDVQHIAYGDDIRSSENEILFPIPSTGKDVMIVFVDMYGNEARELISASKFSPPQKPLLKKAPQAKKRKR